MLPRLDHDLTSLQSILTKNYSTNDSRETKRRRAPKDSLIDYFLPDWHEVLNKKVLIEQYCSIVRSEYGYFKKREKKKEEKSSRCVYFSYVLFMVQLFSSKLSR